MAARAPQTFKPHASGTVTILAGPASTNTDLGPPYTEYRIYNAGNSVAFIIFAKSATAVGSMAYMPIPPGAVEYFRPPSVDTSMTNFYLVAITGPGGNATLYVTPGEGN